MGKRIYGTDEQYSDYNSAMNTRDNHTKGQAMKRLAESGFAPAEYWLATVYLNGSAKRFGYPSDTSMEFNDHPFARTPDYVKGVKWAKKAADHKYVYAYKLLGSAYKIGNGVRQNYKEALKWYFKALDEYMYADIEEELKEQIHAQAYADISMCCCDMQDYEGAAEYSRLALKTAPDNDLAQQSAEHLKIALRYR